MNLEPDSRPAFVADFLTHLFLTMTHFLLLTCSPQPPFIRFLEPSGPVSSSGALKPPSGLKDILHPSTEPSPTFPFNPSMVYGRAVVRASEERIK